MVPGGAEWSKPPYLCPECKVQLPHEAVGPHVERHREVKPPVYDPRSGEQTSRPCPKGCGRHFLKPSEYREHAGLCDGQAPLLPVPPATPVPGGKPLYDVAVGNKEAGMLKCDKCDKEFARAQSLGIHKRYAHGVRGRGRGGKPKKPRPAARRARPAPAPVLGRDTTDGAGVIHQLREKAVAHRQKAAELDEMADKLKELF